MAVQPITGPHPVLAALRACRSALDEVQASPVTFMSPAEKEAALREAAQVAAKLDELGLRLLASAEDVAAEHGARDPAAWLAHATHADPAHARRDHALARALDTRWVLVGAGMAAGTVSLAQARVIVAALEALPGDLDPQILTDAEATLVEHAKTFAPGELRRLGRRLLEVLDPDTADAAEGKRLEEEEQQARERTFLKFWSRGDGTTGYAGAMPDEQFHRWRAYLEAFTSPRKADDTFIGEEGKIPHHRKLGLAFGALLERLDPARLPTHGGTATTVMVTVSLDALRRELATAGLLDGDDRALGPNLSASAARRLACTGQIIPVVLGGSSEILDLGRARRLFSPAQVKALRLRDQQCRAEGCTIPAAWCEAHHLRPWSAGGRTDLANGILYCNYHHHRAHDHRYQADRLPNGDHRFHRRT